MPCRQRRCASGIPFLAPRFVALLRRQCPGGAIGSKGSAAQMIAQQPVQRAVVVHGDALRAGVVILLVGRVAPFVVVAEVRRRHAVERGLDAIAIAVVHEGGTRAAADARQAILGIPGLRVTQPRLVAGDHVSIAVIGVTVAARRRPHCADAVGDQGL